MSNNQELGPWPIELNEIEIRILVTTLGGGKMIQDIDNGPARNIEEEERAMLRQRLIELGIKPNGEHEKPSNRAAEKLAAIRKIIEEES